MNHLTLDEMGATRAQNDITDPCIATTGIGSSIKMGIVSRNTSLDSLIVTSDDVEQHPYSEATIHVYKPESIANGFKIRNAIKPSP